MLFSIDKFCGVAMQSERITPTEKNAREKEIILPIWMEANTVGYSASILKAEPRPANSSE